MSSSNTAFLVEVEDFLVSCDLPTFPLPTSNDSDAAAQAHATPTSQESVEDATSSSTNSEGGKQKAKYTVDDAAKQEMTRAKNRKRRGAYRERQRIEKENLKQQVCQLSEKVGKLQKAKKSVTSTAWEMVAKRHLQARLNAEEEQQILLKAVEVRAKVIQDFSNFMHDRLTNVTIGQVGAFDQHKKVRIQPDDGDIFETYLKELDVLYAQTDGVLSKHGLDTSKLSWSDPKQQWEEDNETGYFIYTDNHLIPTDFEQAREYVWHVALLQHRQEDRKHYNNVKDPENTMAFKFRITKQLNSGRIVSVLQRAVARRYLEEDRMVVVWRAFTEGEAMFTGMYADECGWCVSIPSPNNSEPKTLLKTVMRHVPMHFNAATTREPDAKQFTSLLLNAGSEDATEIGSRLEKLLLHDE